MQEKICELALMGSQDRNLDLWTDTLRSVALRYNNRQMLLPLLLIGAALAAAWYALSAPASRLFLILVMSVLLFCALYSYLGLLSHRRLIRSALPVMLTEEPERIVWLYRAGWELMPFGIDIWGNTAMYIGFSNGSLLQVRATIPVIDGFIRVYSQEYPHVTTGYSVEKKQLFEAEPELLRK